MYIRRNAEMTMLEIMQNEPATAAAAPSTNQPASTQLQAAAAAAAARVEGDED